MIGPTRPPSPHLRDAEGTVPRLAVLALLLLVLGLGLLADSVRRGDAHLWLVLVLPVVSGGSLEFLVGVLTFTLGLVTLAAIGPWYAVRTPRGSPGPETTAETGGVILIGPFPILLGSWRGSERARHLSRVVGAVLLLFFLGWIALALYLAW